MVFVGSTAGGGPSVDTCCGYLNMFAGRETAQEWRRAHPDIAGEIVDRVDAESLGRQIFGGLLD
jgi:hypothetical protein